MASLSFRPVQCPYCGEHIEVAVDESAGEHACIEDCSVCCRPIEISVVATGNGLTPVVRRDDD